MCGIAGSVNFPLNITALTRDLWHRGPDEQATFGDGNLQLHHHRLSIIDIACGKQPMHDEELTIIFNGEIYNHQEVRKEFGLVCHTNSDTETILKAYRKLGPSCLDTFDGMFAFMIYNRNEHSLFIARDRAGKKPFYYYHHKDKFVCASELNALKRQVNPQIDDERINQFLRYGAFHGSATPYRDVHELLPGYYATVDLRTVTVTLTQWWNIRKYYESPARDISVEETMQRVDDILHQAIRRRIDASDLEVGSFLSGGIDSGLVTAIASGHTKRIKTFTVSFTGVYDEAPLARLVAEKYDTDHTEISLSFDHLRDDIEKILSNYGEPFYDDSAIPSYYVSREARKHLTVILNGDGSDELFGGYRRYVPFSRFDFFSSPAWFRPLARAAKAVTPLTHNKQSKLNYIYRLADLTSQKGLDVYLSSTTDIFTGFYRHFKNRSERSVSSLADRLESLKGSGLSGLQKIMLMDFNAILPDILLVKMDIATMANSLEGRSPFLGREMLQFAPTIPDRYKIKGTTTKYVLRKLAGKYLPPTLADQPKRGFEVPLKQWVDNELRDVVYGYLDSSASYAENFVERNFIRDLLARKIKVSDEKRAKMLYTLFALNVWHQRCYLDK